METFGKFDKSMQRCYNKSCCLEEVKMITNQKEEKASISIRRIIGICLIFLMLSGICVFATNTGVKDLTIVLSNNYELNIVTSKTKVADVLDENHIILLPDEKVTPDLEETIGDTKVIKISKITEQEEVIEIAQNTTELHLEQVLKAYAPITEKFITEQEAIPFETITKDVSNEAKETSNTVIQQGKEGIKEVTYRVKYQNDREIERTEVSSVVLQEPVNKIVQVKAKVTNRSSVGRTHISGSVAEYQAYAKTRCVAYGWSEADFNCLVSLWNKESNWNPNAYNTRTGAYGIPQALPASKMATAGTDYKTNYKTQINWGLSYIKSRYGSPSAAWNHSQRKGWY